MGNRIENNFPGRYESLEKICDFVCQAARQAGLDESAVYGVQLAVDEACTNIIEHGYGGEGVGDIQCACEVDEQALTVILQDRARSFDVERVPDPKFKVPLEDLKPRGLGVFLMRKTMDEVRFEARPGGGNILTMKKKVSRV